MTRDLSLAVWAVLAVLSLCCEVLSVATARRVMGVGQLLRRVSGTTAGLFVAFLGWLWLGWHLFAR